MLRPLRTTASKLLLSSLLFSFSIGAIELGMTTDAYAQQPTDKDKERARELMAQGRDARDVKNDLPTALKAFQAANDLMHVPTTAFEVARTQQAMNLLIEAHETIVLLRNTPSSPSDPEPFKEARAKAETLDKDLALQIPTLKISVTSNDPKIAAAATVTVDDQPATLDTPRKVNPGKHTVVARGGGVESSANVTVAAAETKPVDLRLDAKPVETAPPQPPPSAKGLPTLSWIGFGVGAAGLAVGSVTGVIAISKESDISNKCPNKKCSEANRDALSSANTVATISTIGFVVAGLGAAIGLYGYFTRPKAAATTGLWHNVQFAGNGLRGTF